MGIFTILNPFYWKKRALQAEKNYAHACECCNHLQDENVKLKQQIEILREQNRKWFETVLGHGANDFTLLTKSFWGSRVSVVEFDNGKAS